MDGLLLVPSTIAPWARGPHRRATDRSRPGCARQTPCRPDSVSISVEIPKARDQGTLPHPAAHDPHPQVKEGGVWCAKRTTTPPYPPPELRTIKPGESTVHDTLPPTRALSYQLRSGQKGTSWVDISQKPACDWHTGAGVPDCRWTVYHQVTDVRLPGRVHCEQIARAGRVQARIGAGLLATG